eukprot:1529182-Rhodomonas_salina.3
MFCYWDSATLLPRCSSDQTTLDRTGCEVQSCDQVWTMNSWGHIQHQEMMAPDPSRLKHVSSPARHKVRKQP